MQYRKLTADAVFDGSSLRRDVVLILDETGLVQDLIRRDAEDPDVERHAGILSPGFINCHCHLELSHMKGRIPEGTGLVDFVFRVVTERHHGEDEIRQAIAAGEDEMLREGIVAVGDICNNILTLPQKQEGRLRYSNFIEASGWLPAVAGARFQRSKEIYEAFGRQTAEGRGEKRSSASLVPHAPYSVSEALWDLLRPYFPGHTISIHNQETRFEDEFFREGSGDFRRMYELMKIDNSHHRPTGRSSLQSYFDKLRGAKRVLLVHNTFTREDDLDYVLSRQTADGRPQGEEPPMTAGERSPTNHQPSTTNHQPSTFFCLCPRANLYIEGSMPPVDLFRRKGVRIVLGTDSLASNHGLSIREEMRVLKKHFPDLSLEEMLSWATRNGAEALGMEAELGSFEKGKRPGVLLLDEELDSVIRLD